MKLYLGGHLEFYLGGRRNGLDVEILQPTPLSDILGRLGIPMGEVHLAVVNGQNVDPQAAVITEQDEVKLYPAVGGG